MIDPTGCKTCREHVERASLCCDLTAGPAVIGGGYTGSSAALAVVLARANICLPEAKAIGDGGSGSNVGPTNADWWLPPAEIREYPGDDAEIACSILCQRPL